MALLQNPRLQDAFVQTIVIGLGSASATTCDRWALKYRIMSKPYPGPFTFIHHPWLRKMHQTRANKCVGKKAAQCGYTEVCMNVALFTLDQLKQDVLYVLPNVRPEASDFSVTRFDVALENSEYIKNMFNNVKNVGLKRAGSNSLYIRGSRSRSSLKSLPAGVVILDEFEEFDEGALPLVIERMSGQLNKQLWLVSTPMVPNAGIDLEYQNSNQQHFMFICPYCNKITELIFPECLIVTADTLNDPKIKDSHLICKECNHKLDHESKQEWLAGGFWQTFAQSEVEGFYVNQLYSPTVMPHELAEAYLKSLRDQAEEQEFWNSKIGLAHIVANAVITDDQILKSMRDYVMADSRFIGVADVITTLGVDVGGVIHYEITQYQVDHSKVTMDINFAAKARVLKVGTVKNFDELKPLFFDYQIQKCVIDDMPDTRAALAFARQFAPGLISLCHYGMNASAREILDYGERITVNRSVWLDTSLGRFINGTIFTPKDLLQEYKQQIKSLVKIYQKNSNGETISQYKKSGDDHYGHARNYSEIAFKLAASTSGASENIRERVL
jgi:hypothetical protein